MKIHIKCLRIFLICIILISISLCFFNCAPSFKLSLNPPSPNKVIIVEKDMTASMLFKNVFFEIPEGTKIGSSYTGLVNIKRGDIYFQSIISLENSFKKIVNEELKNVGYNVIDVELLSDGTIEAEYLLNGKILDIKYNVFNSGLWYASECSIVVRWELLDNIKKDVIFTSRTTGEAREKKAADSSNLTFGIATVAFRIATKNLLSNKLFVDLLILKKITKVGNRKIAQRLI